MTFPIVLLILGVLFLLTQPGAAGHLAASLALFGQVAAIGIGVAVLYGITLVIGLAIRDFFGEWMLRRRRARTGRSL